MEKIIMLMGPSSSGKDTLYKCILKKDQFRKYNMKEIILHTTRPMRKGETNGKEYYFVDDKEMLKKEAEGKIIEKRSYNTTFGIRNYFTCSDKIDSKGIYITSNTLEAYDQYLNHYNRKHLIPVLIQVNDGIRLQRALSREREETNPRYDEMCRRFMADNIDFNLENIKKRNITDICYNNESIEESLEQIEKIFVKNLGY